MAETMLCGTCAEPSHFAPVANAVPRNALSARVLVTGAGPIDLGAALVAHVAGAEVHLRVTLPARPAQAGKLGLAQLHSGSHAFTVDRFDAVVNATGQAQAIEAGFAQVAHGGTFVLISVVQGRVGFADPELHKREMRPMGSRNATAQDFRAVMAALSSGAIRAEPPLSERIALADLPVRLPPLAADRGSLVQSVMMMEGAP